MMSRNTKGHTSEFLKRRAKTIAKDQHIPHHLALDEAAKAAGFSNWGHFVNASKGGDSTKQRTTENQLPPDIASQSDSSFKKTRIDPYRNLVIAGINELIKKGVVSLTAKKPNDPTTENDGHVFVELFGFTSVVIWRHIGYDEVTISVWWKYDHSLHPQANSTGNARESFNGSRPLADKSHYRKFVGVVTSGWLERKNGTYLQGKSRKGIFTEYTRNGEKMALDKLPIQQPRGFDAEGKFYF